MRFIFFVVFALGFAPFSGFAQDFQLPQNLQGLLQNNSQNTMPTAPGNAQTGMIQQLMQNMPAMQGMTGGNNAMMQQAMQQLNSMTPQQRAALMQQLQQAWQGMSPQAKQNMASQAQSTWQNLNPQQKQSMTTQAMQQWQSMSPQQKQQLASQFSNMFGDGQTMQAR